MNNKKTFFTELKKKENLEKFDLSASRLHLSAVDNIREALDMTYWTDEIFDRIDEAQSKMIEARDIFRFEMMQNLGTAEDELNRLREQLAELGIETPPSVSELEQEITDRESAAEDIRRRFQDAGYDPIS